MSNYFYKLYETWKDSPHKQFSYGNTETDFIAIPIAAPNLV